MFFIGLDNIQEAMDDIPTFGACFQTEELNANQQAVLVVLDFEVTNLSFKQQGFLVRHWCKLNTNELTYCKTMLTVKTNANHCTANRKVLELSLPIAFIRTAIGVMIVATMPKHHPNIQFGWNRVTFVGPPLHFFD